MAGVVILESMWNKKGRLLEEEPSVLPYLKAIRQSLAWEGIRVNLVYRRFYSNYDLGLLLEEVRRRRQVFQVCYLASHGQRRKLMGFGDKVIRLDALEDFEITRSENPQKVAGQLYRDFPLAHDITFSCFTLDRIQGRKPFLVSSFDSYRKNVDRARRLVRDI